MISSFDSLSVDIQMVMFEYVLGILFISSRG